MAKTAKKAAKRPAAKASSAKGSSAKASSKPLPKSSPKVALSAKPAKPAKPVKKAAPIPKFVSRPGVIAIKPRPNNGKVVPKPEKVVKEKVKEKEKEKERDLAAPHIHVPSDPSAPFKRVKNQAGLSTKEISFYRDLLIAKRRELIGDVQSMEDEALTGGSGIGNLSNLPDHMADQGTDNFNQEFTLGLMEKDRQLLREIEVALDKIRIGTYGICEGTGKPIGKPRLEAQPWARFSIEYARKQESGMFRR